MNKDFSVQCLRSSKVYDTKQEAIDALKTIQSSDGSIVLARYKDSTGEIKTLIAPNCNLDGISDPGLKAANYTIYDPDSITSVEVNGSGNAITSAVASNGKLTLKKDTSFATSSSLTSGLAGKANANHTHTGANITGLTASRALASDASGHVTVSAVTATELGYLDGVTSNIQTQLNGKAASSHTHTGSDIKGLTESTALIADEDGNVASSTISTTELGYLDGVTSNIQTQLNNKAGKSTTLSGYGITDGVNAVSVTGSGNAVTTASVSGHTLTLNKGASYAASSHTHTGANITGLTASRALASDASGHVTASAVTATELGYLDGVTSNIQTQLNGKAATSHTHKTTDIASLTASRAMVTDTSGHMSVSAVTSTELGYLDGVTSSIQTQLNNKAGKSTTLSGYGITDGVNAVSVTGSGNAVTTASVSGHTLTLTKGASYATSSELSSLKNRVTDVENIEIGGRNLALNSEFKNNNYNGWSAVQGTLSANNGVLTLTATTNVGCVLVCPKIDFVSGQKYTMSMEIRSDNITNCSYNYIIASSNESIGGSFSVSTQWKKVSMTFTPNISQNGGVGPGFTSSSNAGKSIQIRHFKLELGSKATDWTPAPEDIDSDIDSVNQSLESYKSETTAKFEVLEGEISSKVSTTEISTIKTEILNTASQDAQSKANKAQSNAISAASSDATSKANQAKKDAISSASTDATNKANAAQSNAISQAATDAAKKYATITTVNSMQTSISQLSDEISLKAEKTEVTQIQEDLSDTQSDITSLTERVTSAEAKIEPDAIRLTVKEQTDEIVNNAISGIEVSTNNLVQNGELNIVDDTRYCVGNINLYEDLVVGEEYTIVIKADIKDGQALSIMESLANISLFMITNSKLDENGIYRGTFTYREYSASSDPKSLVMYNYPSSGSASNPMSVYWVCIYKGDVKAPLNFVPAQQDIDNELDSKANKATSLSGYGITDGVNAVSVTGSGNAVTTASVSGHTLTLNKGASYAASSHTHTGANITGLTASRALASDASGHVTASAVTATELGYLDGVTSNIQTQLNGKAASSHTHTGANITGLTASMALASDANGHVTASAVTATELGYLDGVTSSIQTQLNNKAGKSTTLSGYGITDGVNAVSVTGSGNAVTTASVSGHTLTLTKGASFATSSALTSGLAGKANASHTHTGADITGLTESTALIADEDGNVASSAVTSTELGYLDGVTSNIQTQLNNKAGKSTTLSGYGITDGVNAVSVTGSGNAVTTASVSGHTLTLTKGTSFAASSHTHTGANITGLTASMALASDANGHVTASAVTATELGYLDGVTSNIQTQLNGKAATSHTHTGSDIKGLTGLRALATDTNGNIVVSSVTSTELGYLDGVTSSIQTQLSGKAATSHTHTGANITGLTASRALASDASGHVTASDVTATQLNYLVRIKCQTQANPTYMVNSRLYVCNRNISGSLNVPSLTVGYDVLFIIHNTGTSPITITIPNSGGYVTTDDNDSITISGGKYGEIHVISDGTNKYVRSL